nr:MAG TPA: hypothetical protein [Caudoviricetes sp.]
MLAKWIWQLFLERQRTRMVLIALVLSGVELGLLVLESVSIVTMMLIFLLFLCCEEFNSMRHIWMAFLMEEFSLTSCLVVLPHMIQHLQHCNQTMQKQCFVTPIRIIRLVCSNSAIQ